MVAQGHAVAVPEVREKHLEPWRGNTADTVPLWGSDTDFRSPSRIAGDFVSRHKADVVSFGAGIPGYSGFKPHGATVLWGDRPGSPPLEPHLGLGGNSSLDLSKQPYVMPVPGYSGHIRGHRGDGWKSFGTTHWKNAGQVTGHKPAAATAWDNRDGAGRPFGGYTPKDGGVQHHDPDEAIKAREAEEANELLQLRSMGIRTAIEQKRYVPRAAPGLSWG